MARAWAIGCPGFCVAMTALKSIIWGLNAFTIVASPEKGKKGFQDSGLQGGGK